MTPAVDRAERFIRNRGDRYGLCTGDLRLENSAAYVSGSVGNGRSAIISTARRVTALIEWGLCSILVTVLFSNPFHQIYSEALCVQ